MVILHGIYLEGSRTIMMMMTVMMIMTMEKFGQRKILTTESSEKFRAPDQNRTHDRTLRVLIRML